MLLSRLQKLTAQLSFSPFSEKHSLFTNFTYSLLSIALFVNLNACSKVKSLTTTDISSNTRIEPIAEPPPRLSELVDYYDIFHPEIGRKGMVVSQKRLASEIGAEILRNGGNAVDAAVGFALAVVLPRAGNLTGGGFMLVHLAKTNKTIALDYRETAPALAYKDVFLDKNDNPITNKSLDTLSASGVPGTVAGLHYALEKYGSMSWADVIKPAEEIARTGFLVDDDMVRLVNREKDLLKSNAESRKVFFKKNGQAYQTGDNFIQTDLAKTLSYIPITIQDAGFRVVEQFQFEAL